MKKRLMSFLLVLAICGLSIFSLASAQVNAKTTITYWHSWGASWGEQHNAITERFNKTQPDIKVQTLIVPDDEMRAKLLITMAGGNPPDLIHRWGSGDRGFFPGMFMCLDSFMQGNEEEMGPKNWFPGALDYLSFEGKVYGLPWVAVAEGLYYNKDMFIEAGLDPENPPEYWSDLEAAAEKLTKEDSQGRYETLGFLYPGALEREEMAMTAWNVYWSYRNNGQWWDPETKKMTCTNPKNIETWEWFASWSEKYGVEKVRRFVTALEATVAGEPYWFARGKLAMCEIGTWGIGCIMQDTPELNFGITVVPYPEDGKPVHTNYVDSEHIPLGAKHPQEAWKFLFWHITEGQWMWCNTFALTPSRPELYNWGGFEDLPQYDLFKKMVDYQQYGKANLPGFPIRSTFAEKYKRYFYQVASLKIAPQEALEKLQSVMQEELDKFYKK